ncbi:MAG: SPOR domain-containing protein [Pseudomonadota bacterium]
MTHDYVDNPSQARGAPGATADAARGSGFLRTLSTWLGAAVALVLLLGLGTWFYQLGVRDAQSVPVIRASADPVKTRPADAGGEVTPHQDIASYNAGSAETVVEPTPRLAEPAPEPEPEDVPIADLNPAPVAAPEPPTQPDLTVVETPSAEPEPSEAPEDAPETAEEPEAEIAVVTPVPETPEDTGPQPPIGSGSDLAPAFSPTSKRRPADLGARMEAARASAVIDQDQLTEQARNSRVKIQLRASPSRDEVVASWNRIQAANRDLLGNKALSLQTTQSGGTRFFRLRVGPFRDRAEANAVCQALRARNQDCIVTTSG